MRWEFRAALRVLPICWWAVAAKAQSEGVITTIAGATAVNGAPQRGFAGDNGPARKALLALANLQNECDPARFEQISHIALDPQGNLYIADSANQRIRKVDASGTITTFAGNGERLAGDPRTCVPTGGAAAIADGGPATSARLNFPAGVAVHPNGSLILADQQNNRIRQISPSGVITTIAGNGLHAFYAPQVPALSSGLDWPPAVAVAGTGIPGFSGESGTATSVRLSLPTGIAFDSAGNLYIADQGNHRIR